MLDVRRLLLLLFAVLLAGLPAAAQEVRLPALWPIAKRLQPPQADKLLAIRFLTDTNYPPFNYIDEQGTLAGFNVDLARAICVVLKVDCIMRTRSWDKLSSELGAGQGDAIIASMAITQANRARFDFSDRYYLTPSRFIARVDTQIDEITPQSLKGWKVGVVKGSAHQAYLRTFFPEAESIVLESREEARAALLAREVDLLFDDGISLAFFLNGQSSNDCCAFRGGPFVDSIYFGEGAGIAVAKGNTTLRDAINYALRKLYSDGVYEELFLKHFPISFY